MCIEPFHAEVDPIPPNQVEPPLNQGILEREGWLAGAERAAGEIKSDVHPSQLLARQTLEQADLQLQRLHEGLAAPLALSEKTRRGVQKALAADPDVQFLAVYEMLHDLPPREAKEFFYRSRTLDQARRIWECGHQRYEAIRQKTLKELAARVAIVEQELRELQAADLKQLTQPLIHRARSGADFDAAWQELLPALQRRHYRFDLEKAAGEARTAFAKVLDARTWKWADSQGTAEAYETYLKHSPSPRKKREASQRLHEEQAWQTALQLNTPEAMRAFLESHPSSPYADDARREIRLWEERAWKQAQEAGSVGAYEEFLRRHPDSQEALQAYQGLAPSRREELLKTPDNRELRRDYLIGRTQTLMEQDQHPARVWLPIHRIRLKRVFIFILISSQIWVIGVGVGCASGVQVGEKEARSQEDFGPIATREGSFLWWTTHPEELTAAQKDPSSWRSRAGAGVTSGGGLFGWHSRSCSSVPAQS